jgi:hypothetical protein
VFPVARRGTYIDTGLAGIPVDPDYDVVMKSQNQGSIHGFDIARLPAAGWRLLARYLPSQAFDGLIQDLPCFGHRPWHDDGADVGIAVLLNAGGSQTSVIRAVPGCGPGCGERNE